MVTMTEEEKEQLLWEINGSVCVRRAVYALLRIRQGTPAKISRFINLNTTGYWAGTGAGKFFREHFRKTPNSPYFIRTARSGGTRSKYVYELTPKVDQVAWEVTL